MRYLAKCEISGLGALAQASAFSRCHWAENAMPDVIVAISVALEAPAGRDQQGAASDSQFPNSLIQATTSQPAWADAGFRR
jgi:hypothetical protein